MEQIHIHFGGSFAPPLTQEKLDRYRELIDIAKGPEVWSYINDPKDRDMLQHAVPDYMKRLADMVELFWETPESKLTPRPHATGIGQIIDLEDAEKERMWDAIPYDHELDLYSVIFEKISHAEQPELRNAAFHLLWFGRELDLDREPMTNDKLTVK